MSPAEASGELVPVGVADHALGAADPDLTLVEYGDFGCPFCFAASRPVRSLVDRYPGLRLVWRHFPKPELHPGADLAAELSEFASTKGRFWKAHSLLLTGRGRFSVEELLAVARQLDLDSGEAEAALREHRHRRHVEEDVAGAERAGVHVTPTFFVDDQRLEGPWRQLGRLVPTLLAQRGDRDP